MLNHLMENSDLQDIEQVMAINELKKENKQLHNRVRELSSSAASDHSPMTRGKTYKSENEYSESHRRKLKRDRTESCSRSLSWLENQGYLPTMVTVINIKSGEEETIELPNSELAQIFGQSGVINEETMNVVNMMLYVKNWYNVSDSACHELAKVHSQMPRQYKLKERISELNFGKLDQRPTAHMVSSNI